MRRCKGLPIILTGLAGLGLALSTARAQDKATVAPGQPVTIHVAAAKAESPKVSIALSGRHGHATPNRCGCTHTGGGNIDIQQPSSDTVVVTMTGVAVATGYPCGNSVAGFSFELQQCLEVTFDDPKLKRAKLTMEGRVVGLLRSHCKGGGAAEQGQGVAAVCSGESQILVLSVAPHGVACGENLSINCYEGPVWVPIAPGKYTLNQTWGITASHKKGVLPTKAASAEFAPDPALDPLWISWKEPFHGAAKKDFGFQVTIKVAADESAETEAKP